MAKSKISNPVIIVDGIEKEMTKEEFDSYAILNDEVMILINKEKENKKNKEIAIAKFVSLGLTEEDLRMMGL
jgi:hypothetical protein